MLLREGTGGPIDVPQAVAHLAQAASLGHIRAMNFLAHGLYDPESWLGQFGREQRLKLLQEEEEKERLNGAGVGVPLAATGPTSPSSTESNAQAKSAKASKNSTSTPTSTASSKKGSTANSKWKPRAGVEYEEYQWKYNASEQILVMLPEGYVPLPFPVLSSSCKAALPLLKHLAEMHYRTNDVMRQALAAYLDGDLWQALELYDEAADLGVQGAQENAAFLYGELKRKQCVNLVDLPGGGSNRLEVDDSSTAWLGRKTENGNGNEGDRIVTARLEEGQSTASLVAQVESIKSTLTQGEQFFPRMSRDQCVAYFDRQAARRWIQSANTGDYLARREVADRMLLGRGLSVNVTEAALLYSLSAEQGDVQSLISLGWILQAGKGGEWELSATEVESSVFDSLSLWRESIFLNKFTRLNVAFFS